MEHSDLAGMVCARICHDLGNPVGAVVNGVDLIRELGAGTAIDELEMLGRSARRTSALLRFHRLAFGAVRDLEAMLGRDELSRQVNEVLAGPRVELAFSAPEGPPFSAATARLAALMLLAGRGMLGMGGTLRLVVPADAELPMTALAESATAAVSPDQRRWLKDEPGTTPDAPEVEFALVPRAARMAGARVELIEGEGQLALRAHPA